MSGDNSEKAKLLKHANDSYERRDFEEAANYFSELVESSQEKDVEWFIRRCDCLQHLNRDTEAMHDADMVVKMSPESYKGYLLRGALHQIHGRYDEAIFCYFDSLEIMRLSETHISLPEVARKCLDDIIRSARPIAELPEDISERDVVSQLYVLGESLQREIQFTLAIRSMKVALLICEQGDVQVDEDLKMRILFVLGQSQQGIEKFEEAIESFRSSLSYALRVGDISCETKIYLSLSSLCLDQDRHPEAASYFLRLLAVGQDILSAVGGDEEKFREHWSVDMEANILLNLCISFKSMRLYDEAIGMAERYEKVIRNVEVSPPSPVPNSFNHEDGFRARSVPTLGFSEPIFGQRSSDVSGMLQSQFILGDLHELCGDLDKALQRYKEWLRLSEVLQNQSGSLEDTYLLDSASALSCQGSVWLKRGDYAAALDCFQKQAELAKRTKVPQLIMETALSRGEALLGLRRIDGARKAFEYAHKLSRSLDDLEPECMCMWKISSVFAAENRFTHAAYYCEQAVALASKCDKKSVQMKVQFELALYYQHSMSDKELRKASEILYETIRFQESHIFLHRRNGCRYFHEEEEMLKKCYVAMQVILHKLGDAKLSAAFGEAWRRRKFRLMRGEPPKIPDVGVTSEEQKVDDSSLCELVVSKPNSFLPDISRALVLTFTLCAEGLLIQAVRDGVRKSYLSSQFDAKPYETRPRIETLVDKLPKISSRNKEASHLCNFYNSEPRNLPSQRRRAKVRLPAFEKSNATRKNLASGDSPKVTKRWECGAGEGPMRGEKAKLSTLEELHSILIHPMEDVFPKEGENIVIVADGLLKQIPFDSLTNPTTGKLFGEIFNVTMNFSLLSSTPRNVAGPAPKSPRRKFDKIEDFRRSEMLKSYSKPEEIESLEIAGFASETSKLVTETATGTNILTCARYPPPYKQVARQQKCSVVGSPSFPSSLQYEGCSWSPPSRLPHALHECKRVAEYFNVTATVGEEATKTEFVEQLRSSTVLHVATFADLEKGILAFSPDELPWHNGVTSESSYLFGSEDFENVQFDGDLRLLVLSCGHGWPDCPQDGDKETNARTTNFLAEMFLDAGASIVVSQLWNIPETVKDLFFFHFYDALQKGEKVSRAVVRAKKFLRERYSDPVYWSGFVAVGCDVTVDLSEVRRSQLHASLDIAGATDLNLKPTVDEVVSPESALSKLQSRFSRLAGCLASHSSKRDVVGALMELLEESMDRLTADSNTDRPIVFLPDIVSKARGSSQLLQELGFDFQPVDAPVPPDDTFDPSPLTPSEESTAVVFPHWNKDGMLLPTHQALTGLQDLCSNEETLRCLSKTLPLSQALLCSLIDLLSVTRHTPDVQLGTQDVAVRNVWGNRHVRRYLLQIGFMQIHDLIVFYKTSTNRTLLIASLQVFVSLCLHREQEVLERLDVASLGRPPKESTNRDKVSLQTIAPLVLPRKEVILLSSWMSEQHLSSEEERGIKQLARRLNSIKHEYRRSVIHAKWWHKNLLQPQAEMKLSKTGEEKIGKPAKRKVKPGATPSCQRESVSGCPYPDARLPESFAASMGKRDFANYLVRKRCDELEARFRSKLHEVYKAYSVNG